MDHYRHERGPGEKVFIPNEDKTVVIIAAFLNVDTFTVPDEWPGAEAGQVVRVTHRYRALPCPCCGMDMVHLWSGRVGVIECLTRSKFYCYLVPQDLIDAANEPAPEGWEHKD